MCVRFITTSPSEFEARPCEVYAVFPASSAHTPGALPVKLTAAACTLLAAPFACAFGNLALHAPDNLLEPQCLLDWICPSSAQGHPHAVGDLQSSACQGDECPHGRAVAEPALCCTICMAHWIWCSPCSCCCWTCLFFSHMDWGQGSARGA